MRRYKRNINDSALIGSQVRAALAELGCSVVEADDAREAVEALEGADLQALIVCDINRLRMNSLELGADVPVVMLTAQMQRSMIRRAGQLGAVEWLPKPFQPDLLVADVDRLMEAAPS